MSWQAARRAMVVALFASLASSCAERERVVSTAYDAEKPVDLRPSPSPDLPPPSNAHPAAPHAQMTVPDARTVEVDAAQDAPAPGTQAPIRFAAIGDTPGYFAGQDAILTKVVKGLDPKNAFLVHLGDIKGGASVSKVCDRAMFAHVAGILRHSPRPTFVLPGDNEWLDCTSPLEARQLWFDTFGAFERFFATPWMVERQLPDRTDNFAFVAGDTLFIGLGMIHGGPIFDWPRIFAENVQWTVRHLGAAKEAKSAIIMAQAQISAAVNDRYFEQPQFRSAAAAFARPIMYLHGDGHRFECQRMPEWPANLVRVQVDGGTTTGQESTTPLFVTVTGRASDPFLLQRGPEGRVISMSQCL